MSDELPDGWVTIRLGEICSKPQYGWTTSANKTSNGLKLLRTTDISAGIINWSSVPTCTEEPGDVQKYRLGPGDIVISRAGSVGLSHVIRDCPPAVFASYLIRFRPLGDIPSEFLGLFLQSPLYWLAVSEESAGIAVSNINASKLAELEVPLPPLAEQRRIVVKVEALLAEVKLARVRLAKVPAILKRFRQSVLAAASSGRLTEDWREERGSGGAWKMSTVEGLCEQVVDCPHSTPKWTDRGEICLRTTNFRVEGLDLAEVRYVSAETYATRATRLEPVAGDVLYSREGGILGIACVFPEGLRACLGQRMMLMRADTNRILPEFLCQVLNSPSTLAVVRGLTGGTASPHLNVGEIKRFEVPEPSLGEQREIVSRVHSFFSLADTIERRVAAATARADKLTQAILAKAFRGELVRTEAELARAEGREYEPAALLLEKVRQARAKEERVQKKVRRPVAKTGSVRQAGVG